MTVGSGGRRVEGGERGKNLEGMTVGRREEGGERKNVKLRAIL